MEESDNGDYVKYEDYAALESKLKVATLKYTALQSQLSEAREAPTDEEMKKRFCSILDNLQYDGRFQPNRQDLAVDEFIQYVLSTQKPEEGKEPDLNFKCVRCGGVNVCACEHKKWP